jgi:hypothetical protein
MQSAAAHSGVDVNQAVTELDCHHLSISCLHSMLKLAVVSILVLLHAITFDNLIHHGYAYNELQRAEC